MKARPSLRLGYVLLLAASALLTGCGGGSSGGEPAIEVVPPPIQAASHQRYQLQLADAVTNQQISDPLLLTFIGTPALTAPDGSVLNGKTVNIASGLYGFDAAFTPGATDFSIQVADAGSSGWTPTAIALSGQAGAAGDRLVQIKLVNKNKAAAVNASTLPIAMAAATATATADGSLASPISIATPPKTVTSPGGTSTTMGIAKLGIPGGTRASTSDGTPSAPGPLTVSSTYYSNSSPDSLSAFPGGLAAKVQVPASNASVLNGAAPDSGVAVTGGFAQFIVNDSAGHPIHNFSQPVSVGIDVARNSTDQNGKLIAVGSDYPVWSYDETNGKWVFEQMGKVSEKIPPDPDNYTVEFKTNHLSWWSIFWYWGTCGGVVNVVGRPAGDTRPLDVAVSTWGFFSSATTTGSAIGFGGLPLFATSGDVLVFDRGRMVGHISSPYVCGTQSVPVALAPLPAFGSVHIDTSESCADGTQQRALPTYVWVAPSGQYWMYASGYTATQSSTAATTLANLPTSDFWKAWVWDVRNGRYVVKDFKVSANTTSAVSFNLTMPCKLVSGGAGT